MKAHKVMTNKVVTMRCGYVSLKSGRQVHYRTAGDGPPLIILHPSPQSSAAMTASINAFSSVCACYALDTPGYGLSDPMEKEDPSTGDYAEVLMEAAEALGFSSFFIYGAATGSQFAIEMAKRYPDRVCFVMLDSNGHIPEGVADGLVEKGYFADVTPRRDGGHLLTYWDMCRHLFYAFPWNSGLEQERLGFDLPPASIIHDTLLRYLQAGEGYAKAYKAALYTERREHLDGMTTPAVMTRWLDSVVLGIADDLINLGLPDNVRVLEAGHGVEARFNVQVEALKAAIADAAPSKAGAILDAGPKVERSRLKRRYYAAGDQQYHGLANDVKEGRPLVLLHAAGRSARSMTALAHMFARNRPVIALDLPGHGGSPDLQLNEDIIPKLIAAPIITALQEAGIDEIDIVGEGLGGAVGVAVSKKIKTRQLLLANPVPYTDEEIETATVPDISPRDDATHLVSAWAIARDNAMFWPFWDHRTSTARKGDVDLSPETLHADAVDKLRVGALWRDVVRAELSLNWHDLIEGCAAQTLMTMTTHKFPCADRLNNSTFQSLDHVNVQDFADPEIARVL